MKYCIVVPVYNEEKKISTTVALIKKFAKDIVIVNDGSTDSTARMLKKIKGIELVSYDKNMGKGFAMRVGAQKAWDLGAEAIVFVDGDGQHKAEHIPEFVDKLKTHNLVIGVRRLKDSMPIGRRIGNTLMFLIVRFFFRIKISDLLCGFRAIRKNVYEEVLWKENRYGVEAEMTCMAGKNMVKYATVVVDTVYLGKKHGIKLSDGIKILFYIPKLWFKLYVNKK